MSGTNSCHFELKVVVISQNIEMSKQFIQNIPGLKYDPSVNFCFLQSFSFPLYISDSLIINVDLWVLPEDARQRGDAQFLCCDASIVFYISTNEDELLQLLSIYHKDIRDVNIQCHYVACGALNPQSLNSLSKASGFVIQNLVNMDPNEISTIFKTAIVNVINGIPNPPEPSYLMNKHIKLGSLLIDNPIYRKALNPSFAE